MFAHSLSQTGPITNASHGGGAGAAHPGQVLKASQCLIFYFCGLDCGHQLATRINLSTLELLAFDL